MELENISVVKQVYNSRKLPTKEFFEYYNQLLKTKAEAYCSYYDGSDFDTISVNHVQHFNSLSLTRLFIHDTMLIPEYQVNESSPPPLTPVWIPYKFKYELALKSYDHYSRIVTSEITGGDQLQSAMEQWINYAKSDFKTAQQIAIIKALKEKGYLHLHRDQEMQREIRLRKSQFPGHPVYLLMSDGIGNYLKGVYGDSAMWHGAHCIAMPTSTWGSIQDYQIENFHSAVVAKPQIKSNFEVELNACQEREKRRWSTNLVVCHKYALEVDERLNTDEVIFESVKGLERFTDLGD